MTEELFRFDRKFSGLVAGVDEAGRGPLAGPVVCAACIMPADTWIEGINDSKKVPEKKRYELYEKIVAAALAYKVSIIDHTVIDAVNILNATKRGMTEAVKGLSLRPDIVLIDAVRLELPYPSESIVKGDAQSYCIAAASIVAKVTRDRLMIGYDAQYPQYGFRDNKGYGTAAHVEVILREGLCPIHRRSFHLKAAEDGE